MGCNHKPEIEALKDTIEGLKKELVEMRAAKGLPVTSMTPFEIAKVAGDMRSRGIKHAEVYYREIS